MTNTIETAIDSGQDYPNDYPNIGFNPAPGIPANVENLGSQVQSAADSLAEADRLLNELRSSCGSVWRGAASDSFRTNVNDDLAPDLEHAQQSLTKAVGVLSWWHSDLVSNKSVAEQLEEQARAARQAQQQADATLQNAMNDPGLGLAGRIFTDQSEYLRAKATYELAAGRLKQAESDSQVVADRLASIIGSAKELKKRHFDAASRAAEQLRGATNHLAPKKPGGGLFHSIGAAFSGALGAVTGFVKDHLKDIHDVLSTISAVSGVLALCTPPPADAIFGGVALVAGAGALTIDLADPKFRKQLSNWDPSALTTLAGDAFSIVPGGGALAKTVLKGGKGLTEAFSLASKAPGLAVKGLAAIPRIRALGEGATGLDRVLQLGYKGAHDFSALDRLNLLYKTKGAVQHIETNIKDAVR